MNNIKKGLQFMLDKFHELDYFNSNYVVKKEDEKSYNLYFSNGKKVNVSVVSEDCFLYDEGAAAAANKRYSIRVMFSSCYYKPATIFPGEYELNSYNRGVFDNAADLIAYITLDNYLVVIDKKKLEKVFLDNRFDMIIKYGYKYHFDSEKDEILEKVIHGKHVIRERYAIDKYYLEFDSYDLTCDNISDCLTIIDINTETLIY